MANRRMFSKDIVHSGMFLDMPLTSQALYFHLGMIADDDGYAEYKTAMKLCSASVDDLKVLSAKGFVKQFDEYVLIIKHWEENNYIRIDRYQPSRYKYLSTNGIPKVDQRSTEVRLGKDSIGKVKELKEKEINKEKEKNNVNEENWTYENYQKLTKPLKEKWGLDDY